MVWMIMPLPFFSALLAVALAALVLFRNPRARANQLLGAGLTALGLYQSALGAAAAAPAGIRVFPSLQAGLGIAAVLPPLWLAFGLIFGERNGGKHVALWRLALAGLSIFTPVAWIALATGHLILPVHFADGPTVLVGIDALGKAFFSVLFVGFALVLLQFENLYRQADGNTRWKIKFFVVGVFVAFGAQIVATSHALLYGVLHPWHPVLTAVAFLAGEFLIAFSLVRYRLLHVDIFVSRYVVYRSLTLALVGGYLLALGALAEVFHWLDLHFDWTTGLLLGSVGAAGLALMLLSEDARRRVQGFVHTHFYKHKYDYRVEWVEFTRRLAHARAVPDIAAQTLQRILEIMWVRQAAIYIVTADPGCFALAHHVGYDQLPATVDLSPLEIQDLRETACSSLAAAPQLDVPLVPTALVAAFHQSPTGMVVPVAALDTLVGLLVVGPEVSRKPFGVDDRDLLAAIAAQAGAMIVNARLAQEVTEGRDVQALAHLSAFVAHDLKNSVGMLSLLAQNAPLHMHKPEFQADAVNTLTDVTGRMQRLLTALRTSNHQSAGNTSRAGLAAAVETCLRDVKSQVPSRISLETRLEPTPDIAMDTEQMRTVLLNLMMNAIEAIPAEGRITVETLSEDGWAMLTVTDTGHGMSAEFVRDRLFRPFQTTKPRGLGIGLHQCRHIVRAHGGNLFATSQERVGTRMTVRLPAVSESQMEEQLAAGSGQLAVSTEAHKSVESIESRQLLTARCHLPAG